MAFWCMDFVRFLFVGSEIGCSVRTIKGNWLTCEFVYLEILSKCFLVLRVFEDVEN